MSRSGRAEAIGYNHSMTGTVWHILPHLPICTLVPTAGHTNQAVAQVLEGGPATRPACVTATRLLQVDDVKVTSWSARWIDRSGARRAPGLHLVLKRDGQTVLGLQLRCGTSWSGDSAKGTHDLLINCRAIGSRQRGVSPSGFPRLTGPACLSQNVGRCTRHMDKEPQPEILPPDSPTFLAAGVSPKHSSTRLGIITSVLLHPFAVLRRHSLRRLPVGLLAGNFHALLFSGFVTRLFGRPEVLVMADDHSRDRVPGPPLWPYRPYSVATHRNT